jgi:hypothetical protein
MQRLGSPHATRRPLLTVGAIIILGGVVVSSATPTTIGQRPAAERAKAGDGYRTLEAAAKTLELSEPFRVAVTSGATDAAKDAALADPQVRLALAQARQGIVRGVRLPKDEDPAAAYPRYAMLRQIARLLALQQDAELRQGKAEAAIEMARLGMRLGREIYDGPLVAALVGMAIRALPVMTFGRHLDGLDQAEARRLLEACRDWLAEPDPFPGMLAAERELSRRVVRAHFSEVEGAEAALDQVFERALAEGKKPAWQRAPHQELVEESLEARIVAPVAGPLSRAVDLFTKDRAQIRLLAVHAAIRRYRVEEGQLPDSLAVLKLGELAIDPFTGKPFEYRVLGDGYRLRSAGPRAAADDMGAVNGRRPVSVTPRRGAGD